MSLLKHAGIQNYLFIQRIIVLNTFSRLTDQDCVHSVFKKCANSFLSYHDETEVMLQKLTILNIQNIMLRCCPSAQVLLFNCFLAM